MAPNAFERWLGDGYGPEFNIWMKLAWPVATGIALRLAMQLTDTAYLGHLGTSELASGSVAQVWMTLSGGILVQGIAGAVSTLAAQAYGAGNKKLAAVWLRMAVVANVVIMAPLFGLWWWGDQIFLGVGIAAKEASDAAVFMRWSLPGQFGYGVSTALIYYLQSKHDVFAALFIGAGGCVLNVGLNQALIYGVGSWHGFGYIGSPIATTISRLLACVVLAVYTAYEERHISKQALPDASDYAIAARWKSFILGQALPQVVSTALEEWQLQLIAYFVIRLGPAAIATHNATIMLFFLLTSASFGVMTASSVRIGHHLGANNIALAITVAKIGLLALATCGAVVAILMLVCRDYIGYIFSTDPEVIELMSEIMLPVGLGYAFLALFYAAISVLTGQGRPGAIAFAFVIGAWMVTVPLSYVLSNVAHMDLKGIWDALVIGYAVVTLLAGIAALRSDWQACAKEAMQRAEAKGEAQPLISQTDMDA